MMRYSLINNSEQSLYWDVISGTWRTESSILKCTTSSGKIIAKQKFCNENQLYLSFGLPYTVDFSIKLIFNYIDSNNYYYVQIISSSGTNTGKVYSRVDGVETLIFTANDLSIVLGSFVFYIIEDYNDFTGIFFNSFKIPIPNIQAKFFGFEIVSYAGTDFSINNLLCFRIDNNLTGPLYTCKTSDVGCQYCINKNGPKQIQLDISGYTAGTCSSGCTSINGTFYCDYIGGCNFESPVFDVILTCGASHPSHFITLGL